MKELSYLQLNTSVPPSTHEQNLCGVPGEETPESPRQCREPPQTPSLAGKAAIGLTQRPHWQPYGLHALSALPVSD